MPGSCHTKKGPTCDPWWYGIQPRTVKFESGRGESLNTVQTKPYQPHVLYVVLHEGVQVEHNAVSMPFTSRDGSCNIASFCTAASLAVLTMTFDHGYFSPIPCPRMTFQKLHRREDNSVLILHSRYRIICYAGHVARMEASSNTCM
jgi:hypothetical protein